jgi:hypothetical protein
MKHEAIYKLYPLVTSIEQINDETFVAYDANENTINIDMSAVNAKALELQSIKEAEKQAKIEAKASALAKLSALGLTEEEVQAIIK